MRFLYMSNEKILLRIKELKEKLAKTPVNKGTEKELARLKARIAKLEDALEKNSAKKAGYSYSVKKRGDATIVLIGPPSSGKSTLLNALTNARSKTADYEFTTLDVIPGIMEYNGAEIQILDLPGLIKGAAQGKGFGKKVLNVARSADLILLISDVERFEMFEIMKKELYDAGIRLNKEKPRVKVIKKDRGGLEIHTPFKENLEKFVEISREFGLVNAEISIIENLSPSDFLDFLAGNRVYIPCLEVLNKIDQLKTQKSNFEGKILISAKNGTNLEFLKEKIWEKLGLLRIYLKKPGKEPDMEKPLIVRKGSSIADVCTKIHHLFYQRFKFARLWSDSAKFQGRRVGLEYLVQDKDIVELHFK
jgi:small GTP-binding protein